MYNRWLDEREEARAQDGEQFKIPTEFFVDAHLAFNNGKVEDHIDEFCQLATATVADPSYFDLPIDGDSHFERDQEWLKFKSDITTDVEENNTVWARIAEGGSKDKVLVVFHHWNATKWQSKISNLFPKLGITVVEMALPYHFQRARPGSHYADYMVCPNIGRTIQSMRQGVLDGRKLIRWLRHEGYGEISVLGMSLGSVIAGLIATHDNAVSKASLFLTAGNIADVVWEGRATRAIHESLHSHIALADLRSAWSPINLENYADRLAKRDIDIQIVLASRDNVMPPSVSKALLRSFDDANVSYRLLELNSGHYTLGLPYYTVRSGLKLLSQLFR